LGIWNANGTYNAARFHEVMKLFHPVQNEHDKKMEPGVIRTDFDPELKRISDNIPKDRSLATIIYKVISVTWKAVTEGSMTELVQYWSDGYHVDPVTKKRTAAITAGRMKQFYEDGGVSLFQERADRVKLARAAQQAAVMKEHRDIARDMLHISTGEKLEAEAAAQSSCVMM
jgi:hypothetical protein